MKSQLGAEKVKFVKWLMKKGVALYKAKTIANKKFYHGIPADWEVDESNWSLKKHNAREGMSGGGAQKKKKKYRRIEKLTR